jgi:NAD(P)-dependent dehydrogenase (short-subunit alcohol dehydrogenase family)
MSFITLQKPLHNPKTIFTGKIILITGSNTSLGLSTAQKFTSLSASKVILGVRDPSKGFAAKTLIETQIGYKNVVEVWELDMNSYSSILSFAARASALVTPRHRGFECWCVFSTSSALGIWMGGNTAG